MNKLLGILFLFLVSVSSRAQDKQPSITARVIFIGDAGEIDPEQSQIINHAAGQILQGKTTVVYLGDNIYPKGMGLPGSLEEQQTKDILRSQFQPMRQKAAAVYFIPGNHDWDKSGPLGLAKVQAQGTFLQAQNDSLLKMLPANGCPGPVLIPLTPSLSIVVFDSEWWLYPYNKKSDPLINCQTQTKEDVIQQMKDLAATNKNKVLLLASHHPFKSYGPHGGHFTLMQHLFPLRDINKNLYIPLPIIGSIYPLMRSSFPAAEDLRHRDYKEMIQEVDAAFADVPNLIHVAGHDHGLQFIKQKENIQIVSGAGTKTSSIIKGKHALYGKVVQGYVVADYLSDKSVRFNYYEEVGTSVVETFNFVKHYTVRKD
jgi:predicted aconitase with swiveling domain